MNRMEYLMEQLPRELDAMLITSRVGRQYFTGMHSSAGTLLLTRAGGYFIIDSRYILAARAAVKGCEVLLQEKLYEQLNALIQMHKMKRIGVESGYMTLAEAALWQEKLSGAVLDTGRTAGDLVKKMRMVKTPEEVSCIQKAQRMAEQAFSQIQDFIRPGLTEKEIACELEYFCAKQGSERPAFDTIVVSGINSAKPHGVPSDKPVALGELITMDFGCMVDGYCSDMTRTVALGPVSDEMREVYDTVLRAQQASLETIKAGICCKKVDAAARDLISAAGYGDCFGHGTGHSLGLEVHESPCFNTSDESICVPGLIMSVEPGIYLEGKFGVRIEDIVRVTETGCENLASAPKNLIEI